MYPVTGFLWACVKRTHTPKRHLSRLNFTSKSQWRSQHIERQIRTLPGWQLYRSEWVVVPKVLACFQSSN